MEEDAKRHKNGRTVTICSFNINGVRAYARGFRPIGGLLEALGTDILALQEHKLSKDDAGVSEKETFGVVEGFESFWTIATNRRGYSGVWMTLDAWDWFPDVSCDCSSCAQNKIEGRVMITDHDAFVVINVYCPNGAKETDPGKPLKMEFQRCLLEQCKAFVGRGKEVILVGDLNLAANPDVDTWQVEEDWMKLREKGFAYVAVPVLEWFQELLSGAKMLDSFRHLHPQAVQYSWWDTRKALRPENKGTRLDYALVTEKTMERVSSSRILKGVMGSDHCPIQITVEGVELDEKKLAQAKPALSSERWPKQKKISSFFARTQRK